MLIAGTRHRKHPDLIVRSVAVGTPCPELPPSIHDYYHYHDRIINSGMNYIIVIMIIIHDLYYDIYHYKHCYYYIRRSDSQREAIAEHSRREVKRTNNRHTHTTNYVIEPM